MSDVWEIHQQHQELFELLERVNALILSEPDSGSLHVSTLRLLAHLAQHFLLEELLLERVGYPDRARHREEHRAVLRSVSEWLDEVSRRGNTVEMPDFTFLMKHLVDHQKNSDRDWMDGLEREA